MPSMDSVSVMADFGCSASISFPTGHITAVVTTSSAKHVVTIRSHYTDFRLQAATITHTQVPEMPLSKNRIIRRINASLIHVCTTGMAMPPLWLVLIVLCVVISLWSKWNVSGLAVRTFCVDCDECDVCLIVNCENPRNCCRKLYERIHSLWNICLYMFCERVHHPCNILQQWMFSIVHESTCRSFSFFWWIWWSCPCRTLGAERTIWNNQQLHDNEKLSRTWFAQYDRIFGDVLPSLVHYCRLETKDVSQDKAVHQETNVCRLCTRRRW